MATLWGCKRGDGGPGGTFSQLSCEVRALGAGRADDVGTGRTPPLVYRHMGVQIVQEEPAGAAPVINVWFFRDGVCKNENKPSQLR
jgi:hypothetical protein